MIPKDHFVWFNHRRMLLNAFRSVMSNAYCLESHEK